MSSSEEEGSDLEPIEPKILPVRSTRGVRLTEVHGEGDDEFWQQEFWEDKQEDTDFEVTGEEESDVVDSDFDVSEEESDDEEVKVAKEKSGKKSVYVDPRKKKDRAPPGVLEAATPAPKRQKAAGGVVVKSDRTKRKSTAKKTEKLAKLQQRREEQRSKRTIRKKKKAGTVLTQEERFLEAKKTEVINKQSLEALLRIEEINKQAKAITKKHVEGARVLYVSTTEGTGADKVERSLISFSAEHTLGLPPVLRQQLPAFVVKACSSDTSVVAKYKDPVTNMTYSNLEMFTACRANNSNAAGAAAGLFGSPQIAGDGSGSKKRRRT